MNDESPVNPNTIMTNFRTLAKSISSAQSNIFRCKSTLKSIEEELIYLNVNNNTNTNNRDCKKPQIKTSSPHLGSTPYNMVEIDAEPAKIMDILSRNFVSNSLNKTIKSRRSFPKLLMPHNPESFNSNFPRNSNACNISGELHNLMKAQQRLICQIDQLKCELTDKAGSIEVCVKDNQYFNCKFKEVESDIGFLKKDVERIKMNLAMTSNPDRGFSPYSQESVCREKPIKHSFHRQSMPMDHGLSVEHHYGYQDVCTPENSMIGPSIPNTNRHLSINFRDLQGNSRTFEDLMRKSKLDIDCNINNCRNNQNTFSLIYPMQNNPVLQDFACLTNQIKNLRKMAEAIFKGNYSNNSKKNDSCNNLVEANTLKSIDINQEEYSKSTVAKPIAETTLLMLNKSQLKDSGLSNSINYTKRDSSSERTSVSGSDTTACFYNEDQLTICSPQRSAKHCVIKSKTQDHLLQDKNTQHSCIISKMSDDKKCSNTVRQSTNECFKKPHVKYKENQRFTKKQEMNCNCNCPLYQHSKPRDLFNYEHRNQCQTTRSICPECNKSFTIVPN